MRHAVVAVADTAASNAGVVSKLKQTGKGFELPY
jgi:hypothetical protein